MWRCDLELHNILYVYIVVINLAREQQVERSPLDVIFLSLVVMGIQGLGSLRIGKERDSLIYSGKQLRSFDILDELC